MKRFLQITLLLCTMLLMTTEVSAWKFTSVTPESGSKVARLDNFEFVIGKGQGINGLVKNLELIANNGTKYTVHISDNYTGTIAGSLSNPITTDGTYTLTIPAGYYENWSLSTNEEMVYTWTIGDGGDETPGGDDQGGGDQGGGGQGGDQGADVRNDYIFTFDNNCITLTWPNGTTIEETNTGTYSISNYWYYWWFTVNGNEIKSSYIYFDDGDYTFTISAGKFNINGRPNEAININFTIVDGKLSGGDGGNTGDDQGGGDSTPKPWDITITPNEIYVTETPTSITINLPEGKTIQEVKNLPHATFNNNVTLVRQDENTVTISLGTSITEAGEYTLIVPAGAIVATDGSSNNEFGHTWVIKDQAPITGTWRFTDVSPAEGTVTSLKDFKFYGGNITGSKGFTLVEQSTGNNYSFDVNYNSQEDCLEGSLSLEKTTPGTYTIHLKEGFMINEDNKYNQEMTYTWTIEEPSTPEGSGWEFTSVSLAEGEVTEIPKEIILSHNFGYLYEFEPISGILITPKGDKPIEFTFGAPGIITIDIKSIYTDPGDYSITIPANKFHKSVDWEKGEGNKEVTFTWTIKAQPWEFDSVEPSDQQYVESLKNFTFKMPGGKTLSNDRNYDAKITDSNGTEVSQLTISGSSSTITAELNEELTTPGTYTLTIPENSLAADDGTENQRMTYSWTVKARWNFASSSPADNKNDIEQITQVYLDIPNVSISDIVNCGGVNFVILPLKDEQNNTVAYFNFSQDLDNRSAISAFTLTTDDAHIRNYNGITNSGTYTLTIPQGYCKVNGIGNNEQTFTWIIPERDVTLGAVNKKGQHWATFSSNKAVRFHDDVTVYTVSANGATLNMNEITSREVPANTGVLIKCEESSSSKYAVISTASSVGNNLLKPGTGGTTTADVDCKFYRLAYKNFNTKTGLGFYYGANCNDGQPFTCKAGTAYLAVPTSSGARSFYMFDEDDETTGVNNVNENVNENHDVYNLAGQRVAGSHKGIVIVNGKKVVK